MSDAAIQDLLEQRKLSDHQYEIITHHDFDEANYWDAESKVDAEDKIQVVQDQIQDLEEQFENFPSDYVEEQLHRKYMELASLQS